MGDVNVNKLHAELAAAGLPVVSVVSDGRVYYSRSLDAAENIAAAAVVAAHDAFDLAAERKDAYLQAGIDAEVLMVALWEKIIEADSTAADAIQLIREGIKDEVK